MPELGEKPEPIIVTDESSGLKVRSKKSIKSIVKWAIVGTCALAVTAATCLIIWYNVQLNSVSSGTGILKKIVISEGSSTGQIAEQLQKESVIRSSTAFNIYMRLSGKNKSLQAGTYRLSPDESLPSIVEHIVNGSVDRFNVTFFPGATLIDKSDKAESKKTDVVSVLERSGYSQSEIDAALSDKYDSPLFAGKPATADLEGYIYGETYSFNIGASVQDIFKSVFEEYYKVIKDNDLEKGFAAHNMTLYQGITLASIIQREANGYEDQRKVAQVFLLRLNSNMVLGSDVTYQYIADKTGVTRDTNLDSPYNTRRYTGLPPGPISTPGLNALRAVVNHTDGDYLYFLSGDDDVTYFARTYAEHESNIVNHCRVKCSLP